MNVLTRFALSLIAIAVLPISGCTTDGDEGGVSMSSVQLQAAGHGDPRFTDPAELRRTWDSAAVRIPDNAGGVLSLSAAELATARPADSAPIPVIVYLHGCHGFWSGSYRRMEWLAAQGFAVIAPASTARNFYPTSCDLDTQQSGLYRPTLIMRQLDTRHAIEQVHRINWLDNERVFLMGLSEGGAVAATFTATPASAVAGRVIEAWGCHSDWAEFNGLAAGPAEPVLSLVADRDPWYNTPAQRGDCGAFMRSDNGSASVVIDYAPLRTKHTLLEEPALQEIVLDFLLRQARQ